MGVADGLRLDRAPAGRAGIAGGPGFDGAAPIASAARAICTGASRSAAAMRRARNDPVGPGRARDIVPRAATEAGIAAIRAAAAPGLRVRDPEGSPGCGRPGARMLGVGAGSVVLHTALVALARQARDAAP